MIQSYRPFTRCTLLIALSVLTACGGDSSDGTPNKDSQPGTDRKTLLQARENFQTKLSRRQTAGHPVDQPPNSPQGKGFSIVRYDAPGGHQYPAYLYTPLAHTDNEKLPAIIWITGGDCNTIGDVWSPAPRDNDQTASAYRDAGMIMMFPSMRGGNQNPGPREAFLGEVDDVIAARDWLAKQPGVDPNRIYLGGHSTGGTLALLVAACSGKFRAVFSFGPVDNVAGYGPEMLPVPLHERQEIKLRSPGPWLNDIKTPTFIIEGTRQSNHDSLIAMQNSGNPNVHCLPVQGADHFDVLWPTNNVIAAKVLQDTGDVCNIKLNATELNRAWAKAPR